MLASVEGPDTMRSDLPNEGVIPETIAERRAADEPGEGRAGDAGRPHDVPDLLGEIGDCLIQAHRCATLDGDPLTVSLIERALFHVGRRLAGTLSPAEVGVVCH
jgi:hypothetical protein